MNTEIIQDGVGASFEVMVPTREDIRSIEVGSLVPDSGGQWSRVSKVYHRGRDPQGLEFVSYYTQSETDGCEGEELSFGLKEGKIVQTNWIKSKLTQREIERAQEELDYQNGIQNTQHGIPRSTEVEGEEPKGPQVVCQRLANRPDRNGNSRRLWVVYEWCESAGFGVREVIEEAWTSKPRDLRGIPELQALEVTATEYNTIRANARRSGHLRFG